MPAHMQPAAKWGALASFLFAISLFFHINPVLAAVQTNALIKGDGPAVYYLSSESKRYVFPNERIFKTWYQDFSGLQTVSAATLASFPIGGNVKYRAGTRLLKIVSDPTVYAVGLGGTLQAIDSEAAALSLYGAAWSNRVDDLPDAFFFDYAIGLPLDGSHHPQGTLFRFSGQNTYYTLLADANGTLQARAVSNALLSAWRLNTAEALTINASLFPYDVAAPLTEADAALSYPHQPGVSEQIEPPSPNPVNPPPAASPASLTVADGPGLGSTLQVVRNDPAAILYAVVLKGDAVHALTVKSLTATLYVDSGVSDPDFSPGFDQDAFTLWRASEIIKDLQLINVATGNTVGTGGAIDSEGRMTFPMSLDLAANTQVTLNFVANIVNAPDDVRLSVDLNPATGITATSLTASSIAITPNQALNGGASPSIIVLPTTSGKLQVKSNNTSDNQFEPLGTVFSPLSLTFVSTGEPFIVRDLDLSTTIEGNAYLSVHDMHFTYTNDAGTSETTTVNQIDNGVFHFINLHIPVPKNGSVTVPVMIESENLPDVYSNSRLQIKFVTSNFRAKTLYSGLDYISGDFPNALRLRDSTSPGPLTIYRLGSLTAGTITPMPSGGITRYTKTTVLSFRLTGVDHDVAVKRLTFKIETNDVNEDGDDNDLLERYADASPYDLIGLYAHGGPKEDRAKQVPTTMTFGIFDHSAGQLDTTPAGLQTGSGDYGLFTMVFGGDGIKLSAGETLNFDLDLDTSKMSQNKMDKTFTIRARMLGDLKSTSASQANFLWDDGSHINASGYLIPGLDLSGNLLSIE